MERGHRQRNSQPVILCKPDLHIHAQPNKWLGRGRHTVYWFTVSWTRHHILGWNQVDSRGNPNVARRHFAEGSHERNAEVRLLHGPE